MTRPMRPSAYHPLLAGLLTMTLLIGCSSEASPSPSAQPSGVSQAASPSLASITPGNSTAPTPSPTPQLTLEVPARRDPSQVQFSISPQVDAEVGAMGKLVVTVRNLGRQRIDEIVLRWPTALRDDLYLAPFAPSAGRVKEGVPLVVPWTKWVEGPGEHGEPAGTTSLGWGPLLSGAELTIPVVATRLAAGPIAFDLQLLSGVPAAGDVPEGGDALLSVEGGGPAQTRVKLP
jgi:hypothetical protein